MLIYRLAYPHPTYALIQVIEYMPGGEIKWTTENSQRPTLWVAQTRKIFRGVVLGLDYRQ